MLAFAFCEYKRF